MASGLESYVNREKTSPSFLKNSELNYQTFEIKYFPILKADTVSIITSDGRNFVGTLRGFDQTINLILDECHERVYSQTQGVEQVVLGLHIIRGDNVAVVGEVDDEMDSRLDMNSIRADPLGPVVH